MTSLGLLLLLLEKQIVCTNGYYYINSLLPLLILLGISEGAGANPSIPGKGIRFGRAKHMHVLAPGECIQSNDVNPAWFWTVGEIWNTLHYTIWWFSVNCFTGPSAKWPMEQYWSTDRGLETAAVTYKIWKCSLFKDVFVRQTSD